MERYRALGLMSGTSYDAIDVGVIETDGHSYIELLDATTIQYQLPLAQAIGRVMNGDYTYIWQVEGELSRAHAMAALPLAQRYNVQLIGFHGQTIYHHPRDGITVQIGNPHIITQSLRIPVIYDFRRADMARGGQGAPLVPIFLKAMRPYTDRPACFVNIGGVANICYMHGDDLIAFDIGPGNAPLNDISQSAYAIMYDEGGRIAASGKVDENALNKVLEHTYFSKPWPKSLDRNAFDWSVLHHLDTPDVLATMVEVVAHAVKCALDILPTRPHELIISGGGAHNTYMVSRISAVCGVEIVGSSKYDLPEDHLEAYAFAYLAVRSKLGLPITFPSTTGVYAPAVGGVSVII